MYSDKIDVAEIMREIKNKAKLKAKPIYNQTVISYENVTGNEGLNKRLAEIEIELNRINDFTSNVHKNSMQVEKIAQVLPYNPNQSLIMRKVLTFLRRVVRKLSKFIWEQQNVVNQNTNKNLQALMEAQYEIKNIIPIMNCIIAENAQLKKLVNDKLDDYIIKNAQMKEFIEDRLDDSLNENVKLKKLVTDRLDDSLNENVKLKKLVTDRLDDSDNKIMDIEKELGGHIIRDELYLCFENEFRGSKDDIRNRLKFYIDKYILSDIRNKDTEKIIDLGCGRGEWLALLKDNGYIATGIDMNQQMVNMCNESGLDVVLGDALEYLKSLESNSVKFVTGFQLIEHLPMYKLEEFFLETYRVLMFHGKMIFETPNAENVAVGAYNFYTDPTHKRPLHSKYIEFLARSSGFYKTEVVYPNQENNDLWWNNVVKEDQTDFLDSPIARTVSESVKNHFYICPDYAIVATK